MACLMAEKRSKEHTLFQIENHTSKKRKTKIIINIFSSMGRNQSTKMRLATFALLTEPKFSNDHNDLQALRDWQIQPV